MEKKQKTLGNKGFSLVELIIVIAIMAVLVVVLAPQFIKFVEKGRESTDLQNITEMKTAIETYVADHALAGDAAKVVLKADHGTKAYSVTPTSGTMTLTDYGVDPTKTKLQSAAWSDDIIWTYDKYTWTLTGTPYSTYYNADGSDYVGP